MENQQTTSMAAPFNMGVATLMRIDKIMTKITENAENAGKEKSIGFALFTKKLLTKELFLNSITFLNGHKEEIKTDLNRTKIEFEEQQGTLQPMWDDEINQKLDNIIEKIQEHAQDNSRIFMPDADDPAHAILK